MGLLEGILVRFAISLFKELLNRHTLTEKAKLEILKMFDERVLQANLWLMSHRIDYAAAVLRDTGGIIQVVCPSCGKEILSKPSNSPG